jgi:hypothetical protein
MAFYADQRFYALPLVPAFSGAVGSLVGTGTNIGVAYPPAVTVGLFPPPTFIKRTAITNGQVYCTVAPVGGATGAVLSLLNGTNTFATATYNAGTANATVGQVTPLVINTANNTFAAGAAVTGTLVGTVTSAGTGAGAYAVSFEQQELYASSD